MIPTTTLERCTRLWRLWLVRSPESPNKYETMRQKLLLVLLLLLVKCQTIRQLVSTATCNLQLVTCYSSVVAHAQQPHLMHVLNVQR